MLEAYCWPPSVAPGAEVALHVANDGGRVHVEVARDGLDRQVVWRGEVGARALDVPPDASAAGCGWPAATC